MAKTIPFFEYRTWVDLKQFLKTTFKHTFKGLCIAADVLWSLGENFRFGRHPWGCKTWSDAVSLLGRMHKCFCKVGLAMKCYSTSAYFLRGAKNVCVMQTRFKNAHFFCLQPIFIILSFFQLSVSKQWESMVIPLEKFLGWPQLHRHIWMVVHGQTTALRNRQA